jgi:ornithine--oxo-acid transaminase
MSDQSISTKEAIHLEHEHSAHNYHPLPVVLAKGEGVHVWDPEGKKYFDFLSAYSAVNQGHGHPRLIQAMVSQANTLALTSRAFHNNVFGPYAKYITEYFGFEKLLPMNTGAEAVETAIKLCRKWAYDKKGIEDGMAEIIVCNDNFHGRTTTIVSFSTDPDAKSGFGPYPTGFYHIPYNDLDALSEALKRKNVAGFLVEPIQGEAGVMVPSDDFISEAKRMCSENNVLFIADEVQTGIGRTGGLLAVCGNCNCEYKCERGPTYVKPDILILGKALSGGMYPVSAVLADNEVMMVIKPGQHGSTFGGNPLASAIAQEALEVVLDEKLTQNARRLGEIFRKEMIEFSLECDLIHLVRGRGLLNAIVINDSDTSSTAWRICLALKENGLLAKPTHGNIIRLAPPLIITEEQLMDCISIIKSTFREFAVQHGRSEAIKA